MLPGMGSSTANMCVGGHQCEALIERCFVWLLCDLWFLSWDRITHLSVSMGVKRAVFSDATVL